MIQTVFLDMCVFITLLHRILPHLVVTIVQIPILVQQEAAPAVLDLVAQAVAVDLAVPVVAAALVAQAVAVDRLLVQADQIKI